MDALSTNRRSGASGKRSRERSESEDEVGPEASEEVTSPSQDIKRRRKELLAMAGLIFGATSSDVERYWPRRKGDQEVDGPCGDPEVINLLSESSAEDAEEVEVEVIDLVSSSDEEAHSGESSEGRSSNGTDGSAEDAANQQDEGDEGEEGGQGEEGGDGRESRPGSPIVARTSPGLPFGACDPNAATAGPGQAGGPPWTPIIQFPPIFRPFSPFEMFVMSTFAKSRHWEALVPVMDREKRQTGDISMAKRTAC
ncbi:hypothetical protein BSKO_05444 [Bryopsis sp. KO-2023]|nr:hypothetical protein BSKO_05444 [Bryopsis sp. KO-2023]